MVGDRCRALPRCEGCTRICNFRLATDIEDNLHGGKRKMPSRKRPPLASDPAQIYPRAKLSTSATLRRIFRDIWKVPEDRAG